MSTRIDIERLIQVSETASRLKAHWRAQADLYREACDDLRNLQRAREAAVMNQSLYHLDKGPDAALERLDARIAGLRNLIQTREMETRIAADASAEAGRLAEACRKHAKQLGVVLPSEDPYQTEFGGTARYA